MGAWLLEHGKASIFANTGIGRMAGGLWLRCRGVGSTSFGWRDSTHSSLLMGGILPIFQYLPPHFSKKSLFYKYFPDLACSLLLYFHRSPPGLRRAPNKQNESGSILYEEPSHYGGGIRLY